MKKSNEEKNEKKVFTHAKQSKQVNTQTSNMDNKSETGKSQEKKDEFNYFYGLEVERFNFYRIPKLLFTDKRFKKLSCESKVLYGLMLDRTSLSIKNKWLDEQNRAYIIFTQEDTMEYLNCAKEKASKLMKELTKIGLIEVIRQGLNKPNIIYVKNFFSVSITKNDDKDIEKESLNAEKDSLNTDKKRKFENRTSRSRKIELQEVGKSNANYTDLNNTNLNDTENPSSQSNKKQTKQTGQTRQTEPDQSGSKIENVNTLAAYETLIKENIAYADLCNSHQYDIKFIDEIVSNILDVVMSEKKKITVAGEQKNIELVKSVLLKLNYYQIEYVIEKYKQVTTKITNKRQYILTMLYNARLESESDVINEVAHDLSILPNRDIRDREKDIYLL